MRWEARTQDYRTARGQVALYGQFCLLQRKPHIFSLTIVDTVVRVTNFRNLRLWTLVICALYIFCCQYDALIEQC